MSTPNKKQVRVAFIGVNPSEKVMLKGYFGFLLRTEVEFQWVAGNEPNIDLYLINEQFKGSPALKKISESSTHPHAILYVNHDDEQGYIQQNCIHLPLHNLNELKEWLNNNLKNLGSVVTAQASDAADIQTNSKQPSTLSEKIARFMKTLHKRSDKLYEFYDGQQLVGSLHPKSKKLWLQQDSQFNTEWELKASEQAVDELANTPSEDATQWIWKKVVNTPEQAQSVIDTETPVALKSWFKPTSNDERRDLVRLFTILRKREYTVTELAEAANMELQRVHSFVAALLISGSLYVAPDRMLNVQTHSELSSLHNIAGNKRTAHAPKESKSKGFLSSLRKKFGL